VEVAAVAEIDKDSRAKNESEN